MDRRLSHLLLLALLAWLPHWPALDAGYVQDDFEFVVQNASVASLGEAVSAFDDAFPPDQPERGLYRPLVNLSHALDTALFGASAGAAHAVNLALYVAVVWLVYALGLRLFSTRGHAFGLAALFALHPVHSEAVDALAGRSELLALFFSLVSLVVFAWARERPRGRERQAGFVLAWLAFAAALLCKESAAMLAGWILVGLVLFRAPARGRSLRERLRELAPAAPFLALLPLYGALRFASLGRLRPDATIVGDLDLASRFWTAGRVVAEYARLLVLPHPLQVDFYYQHTIGIEDAPSWLSIVGWLAAMTLAGWLGRLAWQWLRGQPPPDRTTGTAAFGAAGALLFLLPVSHVVPFGALMAERFLFAPSLGFAIAVVAWATRVAEHPALAIRPRVVYATGMLVGVAFFALSFDRARDWRDEITLWESVAEAIPQDPRVLSNLASGHLRAGNRQAAANALERALALDPEHLSALNNLAFLELQAGRREEARSLYRRTVVLDPENHLAWNNLGVIATSGMDHATARELYARALAENPNYATARQNLLAAEANISHARRLLASHSPLDVEQAALEILREHALACFVAGDPTCAKETYAVLRRRAGRDERWHIEPLDAVGLGAAAPQSPAGPDASSSRIGSNAARSRSAMMR